MRITFQYQAMMYKDNLQNSLNRLMDAADKADKQSQLNSPESSPTNYVSAYNTQRNIDDMTQFIKNAQTADGWLSNADDQLQAAIKIVSEARNVLAINGANGVHSSESLKALAGDVLKTYNELFDLANSQYMGQYMFGGFETESMPFLNKPNSLTSVSQVYGSGGGVSTREIFSDLAELKQGEYTVEVSIKGDTGYLKLFDKYGKQMVLDSNGTDDKLTSGNSMGSVLTFKAEPGAVINTGKGVSVTLPKDVSSGTSLKFQFNYNPGSSASYFGDDGKVNNKIGFNQDVQINLTGRDLFMAMGKTLRSSKVNTINGMLATSSTYFSQLDKSNSKPGDSVKISGTDHLGRPVGTATVLATDRAKLDLSSANKDERTFTVGFAGKYYQVEVPAKGYKTMDDLVSAINGGLKTAQYAGAQALIPNFADENALATIHNNEINAGLTVQSGAAYQVDLSAEIKVSADGDRLSFNTTSTGDQTALSITGSKHNPLGFDDKTVASMGKDTVFEIGNDFTMSGYSTLSVQHDAVDLSIPGQVNFIVNGKSVTVDNPGGAVTKEAKELLLDKALNKAGLGFTVTAKLTNETPAGSGVYDVSFTLQNMNNERDTHLSSLCLSNAAGDQDYQMSSPKYYIDPFPSSKTMGDYMGFIQNLYGNAVDVYLDGGRVVVEDLRTGTSRLSMNIQENNEGISLPQVDHDIVVSGKYDGTRNQKWNVTVDMQHQPNGSKTAIVSIKDMDGNLMFNKTYANYSGQPVETLNGVMLTLDDLNTDSATPNATTQFNLVLTANSSLRFGDMNVIQEGKNVNAFDTIKNLYDALNNGLELDGAGAPSSWKNPTPSTATPYFDMSQFGGHYNANLKYEVATLNGKTDFFLQKEYIKNSGNINYLPGAATVDFAVQIYDNDTKTHVSHNVSVNLAAVTNKDELEKAIADSINNDSTFYNQNIHATVKDGKVSFESNSGVKNISIKPLAEKDVYMMGVDGENSSKAAATSTATSTFDVHYENAGVWQQLTVNSGPWANLSAEVANINSQLVGTGVTASLSDGKITFASAAPFYYDNVNSPSNDLGISNHTQNYIAGDRRVPMNTTELTAAQRTITFMYNDGTDRTTSIEMPAKEYTSNDELLTDANNKLTAAGLNTSFKAVMYGDRLAFEPQAGVNFATIEGDHEGSLGFPKSGDKVEIKVTDDKGHVVQNLSVDTSNFEYHVADGLMVGFDKGSLIATDSFTGTVGSGAKFEISILDQLENQLLQMHTIVGNRQSRVTTVMDFHKSIIKTSETQKAQYMGSTENDLVDIITQHTLAQTAYSQSMSITAKMLQISILDFLR